MSDLEILLLDIRIICVGIVACLEDSLPLSGIHAIASKTSRQQAGCDFWFKIEYDSHHTSILVGNIHIVLIFKVVIDGVENGFELESATHQVEQEGEDEITHVIVELSESLNVISENIFSHLLAVHN